MGDQIFTDPGTMYIQLSVQWRFVGRDTVLDRALMYDSPLTYSEGNRVFKVGASH